MNKLRMIAMCLFAMMVASLSVKAQEVTITLMPGWTWISCPGTEVQDFATALGSFTPMEGDIIKSQWGNSTYRADGHWRGSISQFYPGYGYMYYSNRPIPVTVTFNAQQPTSQVVVTTSEPMLITDNSAMGGGNVISSNGDYVSLIVKGICWATHQEPTLNDNFIEVGNSMGEFTATMTGLNISTTYYVRAYAVTPQGTVYGDQKTFTTRDGIPTLTTAEVTSNGANATCGGNITDDGGLAITARGVCWSTLPNPTITDSHTANGSGIGSYSSFFNGLSIGDTYYVRAYAITIVGTAYGEQKSFVTYDSHAQDLVDLGLPSGLLWATCNVGANSPEEYGDYFPWGETQPKDTYNWSTYQYCMGSYNTLIKYCNDSYYGYNGFTDNLTTLLPEDDAATAKWGNGWRMPTVEEWQELRNNTTVIWTAQNGVYGRLFTAANGNSIFLPAAGYRDGSSLLNAGSYGYYRSSSLYDVPQRAWYYYFHSNGTSVNDFYGRGCGQSVRAVRSGQN